MDKFTMIWLVMGVTLILLEFIIPGAILSFIGISSLVVGGLLYFKTITSVISSLLAFFIISIFLIIFVRTLFLKLMPGDTNIENTDEESMEMGSTVEVIEPISQNEKGRIRFRETTWTAESDQDFNIGEKAIIVKRIGNGFYIKKSS